MRSRSAFGSGSLFGVCIKVAVTNVGGPVSRHTLALRPAGNGPVRHPAAPGTIIEYCDSQCLDGSLFRARTFPRMKAALVDSGQLRFIHRHLPSPAHPQAVAAAEAAACAGDRGFYWITTDLAFARAGCLDCQGVSGLPKAVPLDRRRFEQCVSSERRRAEIGLDVAEAKALDLQGPPSFVLRRTTSKGVEGVVLQGALPVEESAARIDRIVGKPIAASASREQS